MSELTIRLLKQNLANCGDDLARAERQFRDLSPRQMKEFYGESGKTKQQILDEYKAAYEEAEQELRREESAA